MSQINVSNLSFSYNTNGDNIFDAASFQIDTDWKLGFIGRNGKGKTTFLKLLMGEYEYSGTISSKLEFEYFPFEIENDDLTIAEIAEKMIDDFEMWKLNKELSLLDVTEDVIYRAFSTLSNGERTKVLLSILFLKENKFLLIDEPTNHLDTDGRKIVGEYLNNKNGFILVSHDRTFLDSCIDHVLSLNKKNIEVQRGNFTSWQKNKELQDEFEINKNEKLKKDVKKLETSAKQASDWSDKIEKSKFNNRVAGLKPDRGFIGHKSAKMMKRSKNLENRKKEALEEKSSLLENVEKTYVLKLNPLKFHSEILGEIKDLSINYDDRVICENITFDIRRGERINLAGRNGCGKSSVLKLILGENIPHEGYFKLYGNFKISYIPQDASYLKGELRSFIRDNNIDETLFKSILACLDVSRTQFEKDMGDYSMGQKKKVLLAKSLSEEAHLYIWDEPLNYIDVLSKIQIENLLTKFEPTLIFAEHDKSFSENIATKTIYF